MLRRSTVWTDADLVTETTLSVSSVKINLQLTDDDDVEERMWAAEERISDNRTLLAKLVKQASGLPLFKYAALVQIEHRFGLLFPRQDLTSTSCRTEMKEFAIFFFHVGHVWAERPNSIFLPTAA